MPYISKSLQSCVYCIRKKLWSMLSRSFPELCTITTSDWILIMVLTSWRSQIPQNIKYCLLCLSFMCCAARFGLWPLSFPVRSCAMHDALRSALYFASRAAHAQANGTPRGVATESQAKTPARIFPCEAWIGGGEQARQSPASACGCDKRQKSVI